MIEREREPSLAGFNPHANPERSSMQATPFSVAPGELLVVVGPVGSFKSTLLQVQSASRKGSPYVTMDSCSDESSEGRFI